MTGLPGFAAWGLAGLLVCTALLILRRPVAQLIRLILQPPQWDWPPWPCFPRLVRHWA